jgi:hypothetical protein
MNNTGTKIEMSSARDKSLTFLITGRSDSVLRVSLPIIIPMIMDSDPYDSYVFVPPGSASGFVKSRLRIRIRILPSSSKNS